MYGKEYSINEDSEKSNVVRLSWDFIRFCQFLIGITFWQNPSEKDANQIFSGIPGYKQWDLFGLSQQYILMTVKLIPRSLCKSNR